MVAPSSRAPFRVAPEVARRRKLQIAVAGAILAGAIVVAPGAEARLTKFQVTTRESPTFGGFSYPGIGQYEKIVGKGFGEINPSDPKNAVITDIQLAPKNANGNVEYSFDFYILKPIDLSKGAHRVMYEPPNRGGKTHGTLNRTLGGNDPGSVTRSLTRVLM